MELSVHRQIGSTSEYRGSQLGGVEELRKITTFLLVLFQFYIAGGLVKCDVGFESSSFNNGSTCNTSTCVI